MTQRTNRITRLTMLRGSAAALGGAALAPLMFACGGGDRNQAALDPNEEVSIDYWIGIAPEAAEVLSGLIDEFQGENDNITVSIKRYPDYAELNTALQAALAANNAPTMAGLGYNQLRYSAEFLPHATITEVAGSDDRWLEQNFNATILNLGQVDGEQHILPFLAGTPYLFYNADVFEQAGLTDAPRTWPELREHARRLTEEIGRPSFTMPEVGYFWAYQSLIESNNALLLAGSEGDYRTEFDNPGAIEALQFMSEMVSQGTAVLIDEEQAVQSFRSGQLPMMTGYSSQIRAAQKDGNFVPGSAPLPAWEGKELRVPVAGNGFFVLDGADPSQQAAAWRMVKFLFGPEKLTTWSEGTGYPPTRKGIAEDPRYVKPFFDSNELLRPEVEQLQNAVPWVSFPGRNGPQALEVLVDARDRVVTDGQDAASVMTEAAEEVNGLLNS